MDRLLAGPALTIYRGARYCFRKTRREYGVAPYIQALLSNLHHTTYNDIFYQAGINACALD